MNICTTKQPQTTEKTTTKQLPIQQNNSICIDKSEENSASTQKPTFYQKMLFYFVVIFPSLYFLNYIISLYFTSYIYINIYL